MAGVVSRLRDLEPLAKLHGLVLDYGTTQQNGFDC